jgi:hypothetical protein
MKATFLFGSAAAAVLLAACGDSDRHGLVGEWQGHQGDQRMTIVFEADSTFVLQTGTFSGEGTFTVDAERRVVLRPTGVLAIAVPAGYSGSVRDWTLNLCGPGGLCTDFEKMEEAR